MERIKRFSSIWRQLKLTGLLKQHRYPTGEENSFEYQYELLDQPDSEAPYLVNHHADGSVSSERTISEGRHIGITWRATIRQGEAPISRTAAI